MTNLRQNQTNLIMKYILIIEQGSTDGISQRGKHKEHASIQIALLGATRQRDEIYQNIKNWRSLLPSIRQVSSDIDVY